LSYGHIDHTGGLREILLSRGGKEVEIIAHPDIWAPKFVVVPVSRRLEERSYNYAGIPYRREELEDLGASFNLTRDPTWITDNIVVAGEIPMTTEYEKIESGLYVKEDGKFYPDPLLDDRAIFIRTEEGLVIILGCCHRGIIIVPDRYNFLSSHSFLLCRILLYSQLV
jgi:7,8-dihydropterin-6-yl-methyl-4-(beta-D-ribofuranosyl)aminobenzene 5'-phosphate synthase